MELSFILLLVCTIIAARASPLRAKDLGYSSADLASDETLLNLFHSWAANHNKPYLKSPETKSTKFGVFKDNLNHIVSANKKRKSHWLGLNAFADMTHDEFKHNYLGLDLQKYSYDRDNVTFMYKNATNLPTSIDWRKKGAVTPVKNQGGCGI